MGIQRLTLPRLALPAAACLLLALPLSVSGATVGIGRPLSEHPDDSLDPSVTPRLAILQRALQQMGEARSPTMIGANRPAMLPEQEPLPADLLEAGAIGFGRDLRYRISSRPFDIGTADLNQDGRTDVVLATETGLTVLLGGVDGLQPPIDTLIGQMMAQMAIVDLDGDGVPEVFTTSFQSDYLVEYAWAGDQFVEKIRYEVGAAPYGIAPFDGDGDGDLDVAVGLADDNGVAILENIGGGVLKRVSVLLIATEKKDPGGVAAVVAGDMNGDHVTDLVAVDNWNRGVAMFPGRGDLSFGDPTFSGTGPRPYELVAGDVDGDGDLDLAFADYALTVLANDGSGFFTRAASYFYATGWGMGANIKDLDQDGFSEILTAWPNSRPEQGRIAVIHGPLLTSTPTGRGYLVQQSPADIAFGDFNDDGLIDVVTANAGRSYQGGGSVSLLLNRGHAVLASSSEVFLPRSDDGGVPWKRATDLSAISVDGLMGLALSLSDSTYLMRNDGHGWFRELEFVTPGAAKTVADLDGDGNDDLIVEVEPGVSEIKLGDGAGHFVTSSQVPAGGLLGDLDGDGRKDLVYGFTSGHLEFRRNLGAGLFDTPREVGDVPSASRTRARLFADLNGKPGDELILAIDGRERDDTLEVWTKDRSHRFGNPVRAVGPSGPLPDSWQHLNEQPIQLGVADFNNDGWMDIALLGGTSFSAGYVTTFLNEGDAGWKPMPPAPSGAEVAAMTIADFDLDGFPDVATAATYSEDPGYCLINRGVGDGRLEYLGIYYPGDYPVGIVSADFDGDRLPDLALNCLRRGSIGVLMNTSVAALLSPTLATVEAAKVSSSSVHVEWSLPSIVGLKVERTQDGKHWSPLGQVTALASGRVAINDPDVIDGKRYGYRLVATDERVRIEGSEVWVKVMPRSGIRLREVASAAASRSEMVITIDVDTPAAGRLEVFDVTGRRLASRREVRLTEGAQDVVIDTGARLTQGVYWVRFQGAEGVVCGRVVLLR